VKKALYGLGGLVAVGLIAALVLPAFIDANAYKGRLAEEVQARTGRTLTLDGDLSLSILPLPTLSTQKVRLSNIEGGAHADMFTLDGLKIRVGLLPLLTGTVQVHNVTLVNPVIHLETLADGRRNWDFAPPVEHSAPTDSSSSPSPEPTAAAPSISLDNLVLENGFIEYRDSQTAAVETLSDINLTLAAESLSGPFQANGGLTVRGLPLTVEAAIGEIGQDKASPVNIALTPRDSGLEIGLSGLISTLSSGQEFRGTLIAKGDDLSQLTRFVGEGMSLPPQAFALESAVIASAEAFGLTDLLVTLGENRISGAVTGSFGETPQVDATLTFTRFDATPWLDDAVQAATERETTPASSGPEGAPAPPPPTAAGFSLPSGIAANLVLSGEAITYNGGLIDKPEIALSLSDGVLSVMHAKASLPGGGAFLVKGSLAAIEGAPYLDATVSAKADSLRDLLGWLKVDVADVPANRLRLFTADFGVRGSPKELQVFNLDGRLDTTAVRGAATLRLSGRPAIGAHVKLDRLNVDAYRPPVQAPSSPDPAPAPSAADVAESASAVRDDLADPQKGPFATLGALNDFDANLKLTAEEIVVDGKTLRGVEVDGGLLNGVMSLTKAGAADVFNSSFFLHGKLKGFGKTPAFQDFGFHFLTTHPAAWAKAMDISLPADATKLGSLAASATVTGDLNAVAVTARGEAGGLSALVEGALKGPIFAPTFDLTMEASHASLPRLLALVSEGYKPSDPNLGAFALTTKLAGSLARLDFSDVRGKLGPVNLAGKASVLLDRDRPLVQGVLDAGDVNVTRFLPVSQTASAPVRSGIIPASLNPQIAAGSPERWSKEPIDLSFLQAFDADMSLRAVSLIYNAFVVSDPRASLTVKDGVADVPSLTGTMFDGTFSGQGRLSSSSTPSLTAHVDAKKVNIKKAMVGSAGMDVADGVMDFVLDVKSHGGSSHALISALNGNGVLKVINGVVQGIDLDRINQQLSDINQISGVLGLISTGMQGGSTRFDSLNGTFQIAGGVVTTRDLTLLATSGRGAVTAQVDLPAWTIDANAGFTLASAKDAPPFSMRIKGSLDNPRKVFDINGLQSYLATRGAGRLLQKFVPGLKGPDSPTPQPQSPTPQPQQSQPRPEDLLKGLLKGLGR